MALQLCQGKIRSKDDSDSILPVPWVVLPTLDSQLAHGVDVAFHPEFCAEVEDKVRDLGLQCYPRENVLILPSLPPLL